MVEGPLEGWSPIGYFVSRTRAQEAAYVLEAVGIDHRLRSDDQGDRLWVRERDLERAENELRAYAVERETPPTLPLPTHSSRGALNFFLGLSIFLSAIHLWLGKGDLRLLDWGSASSDHILRGELWRGFTALFLHLDTTHLLSNVIFGAYFFNLMGRYLTLRDCVAGFFLSGVAGNWMTALFYQSGHDAIGLSTAVFGSVGILSAFFSCFYFLNRSRPRLRYLLALGAGFFILGFFGMEGENTDLMAHLFGFLSGLLTGWAVGWFQRERQKQRLHSR